MEDRLALQTLANGFTDNHPFPFPPLFARWYVLRFSSNPSVLNSGAMSIEDRDRLLLRLPYLPQQGPALRAGRQQGPLAQVAPRSPFPYTISA